MTNKRVTRNSSCGLIGLPVDLACERCKKSISRAFENGVQPKRVMRCTQPWVSKWGTHREIRFVRHFNEVNDFLGNTNKDGDILVDTYLYTQTKSSNNVNEVCPQNNQSDASSPTIDSQTSPSTNDPSPSTNAPPSTENTVTAPASIPHIQNESHNNLSDPVRNNDIERVSNRMDTDTQDEINIGTLPKSHTVIHKSHLSSYKSKAKMYDTLSNNISRKYYQGNVVADNMLGFAASCLPQAGYDGIARVLPFIIGSFLQNCGISYNRDKLVTSLPSNMTIKKMVEDNAVDNILLTQESIRKNRFIYICCDKGNKKGNKNLPKFICWYDYDDKKVKVFMIDCDCTDESTEDVALALKHSLERVFPAGVDVKLVGQCTDSGGGGTKHALRRALADHNLVLEDRYLVATCSLHNIQTMLRNAIVTVMGEGGQDEKGNYNMNVMQMLHGAYNIQNYHEQEGLKQLWSYLNDDALNTKFKKLEEPVLTRWWLVGACACSFRDSVEQWIKICGAIRNSAPSNSAPSKISSCTLNLTEQEPIMNDLHMLCSLHEFFIFPHFKYLQLGDKVVGSTPSFQARHILLRYFLMNEDIEKMKNEWMTLEKFKNYCESLEHLNTEDKVVQNKKRTHIFNIMQTSLHKHFCPWAENLFFLAIFSDQPAARVVVRTLLGQNVRERRNEVESYFDVEQNKTINLNRYAIFLEDKVSIETRNNTRKIPFVRENAATLTLIANGINIWDENYTLPFMSSFKDIYSQRYSALPTNTQFGERGVKESGYVSLGRRNESSRSVLAISRGKLLPESMAIGRGEIQTTEDSKVKQLQGKKKATIMLREFTVHNDKIKQLIQKRKQDGFDVNDERRFVKKALTNWSMQFKTQRITKQVQKVIATVDNNPAPNVYQRRTGQTLTPLIEGKIQFGKMLKKHNMEAVKGELLARELGDKFDNNTNWTNLLKILKEHEKNKKYFTPLTNYDAFKWNCNQVSPDGELL